MMKKRLLSAFLAVMMIFTMLPTVFAADDTSVDSYEALVTAINEAADGDTITLTSDIDIEQTLIFTKKLTLNLAGHKLYNTKDLWNNSPNAWSLVSIRGEGDLTITGNGTLDAKQDDCYAVDIQDETAKVTIENGTFIGNISAVYVNPGTLVIKGGSYSIKQLNNNNVQDEYGLTINCYDDEYKAGTAKVLITGGTFAHFNPVNNFAEGKDTNFATSGYEAVEGSDSSYTVQVKSDNAAAIDDIQYATLADAVAAAEDGATITLLKDTTGSGIGTYNNPGKDLQGKDQIPAKSFTIDFNKHTYSIDKPAVGSKSYETQGFHLEWKGSVDTTPNITLKNGTLNVAEKHDPNLKLLVQNYCNLTFDNMTVDGTNLEKGWLTYTYVTSNCNGMVNIKDSTIVSADPDNDVAFDVDGVKRTYGPVKLAIDGDSKISGKFEVSDKEGNSLTIKSGYFTSDPSAYCVAGKTGVASDIDDYKFMVGELKENDENIINVVPDKGANTSSISSAIKAEDKQKAEQVASAVDTVETISDSKTISDKEKLNAVTALKNIGAITVDEKDKIEGDVQVSIIKETYLDVTVKDYVVTGDSNVYTISMDITPKYNLIATAAKGDTTNSVTFSTGNTATVTAKTEVTVTLPKEFAGKLVYINHNDKNLYTATADENGKITFVTDGFSPFTFTLTKPSIFNTSSGSSGGSSSKTTYKVSTSSVANGGVNVTPSSPAKGDKVTITLSPNKGYKLGSLTVTDASGKTVSVTKTSDTVYTFVMPASQVTVGVTYVKADETTEQPSDSKTFSDVSSSDWFADAVKYVSDKGMMNGVGGNKFAPSASTTRGMLMTVIARYAGADTTGSDPWYQKGMEWAKANGVSDGTAPNANITREQLVTMLYRYAKASGKDVSIGEDTNILSYTDATTVSEYAIPAMQWACGAGIVNGSNGKLNPQNNATRAEVAAILMRYCENIK